MQHTTTPGGGAEGRRGGREGREGILAQSSRLGPAAVGLQSLGPQPSGSKALAMAQPSAWLHCCWCRIGLICERFPPGAETLGLNARVAALDERIQRFSRQLEEMDAQLAVLEDQMAIANTILWRREGEGPRVNAPPPRDERREGEGPRVKAAPPELLRLKAPPPVPLNGR